MASFLVSAKKNLRRTDTRKSHSGWWDNHIRPKNSKWLTENLEEMAQNVKQMLKLIDEDADSFAKKVEMYYKTRPELTALVEEFYRMYCSLAERYDHLTGELRKNIPSDLNTQGSSASDFGSEPASPWVRRYSHRAAGSEFFLGSGGNNSDLSVKGDETSSVSDCETESSDFSSIHNYSITSGNTGEEALRGKMMELEVDLGNEKELVGIHHQENDNAGSFRGIRSENLIIQPKDADYEEELRLLKEKNCLLEGEIAELKLELQKFSSLNFTDHPQYGISADAETTNTEKHMELIQAQPDVRIEKLVEELRMTKETAHTTQKEVHLLRNENKDSRDKIFQLRDQLKAAQKDAATWKAKVDTEKRQASKLQERIARYKASLTDRENEIRELKEIISDVNKKYQLHAEISRLQKENAHLQEKLREWETHCHSLEARHRASERSLSDEVENLKAAIAGKTDETDGFKTRCNMLMRERDELCASLVARSIEVFLKDDDIDQISKQLKLVSAESEGRCKRERELELIVQGLEEEVARLRRLLLEGAEEKREVIRQLCFSLEHYRNRYNQLRQAIIGDEPKRVPVLAS